MTSARKTQGSWQDLWRKGAWSNEFHYTAQKTK